MYVDSDIYKKIDITLLKFFSQRTLVSIYNYQNLKAMKLYREGKVYIYPSVFISLLLSLYPSGAPSLT